MRTTRRHVLGIIAFVAMFVVSTIVGAAANTTIVVTADDVGVSWFPNDTRSGGSNAFVSGPATPPLGSGSLQMTTDSSIAGSGQAKAQLFNYSYVGTALADIGALSYWDYRSSSSTNSLSQRVSINVEVDYVGDGSSFTTLVFEPVYQPGGAGALLTDTWQSWDAIDDGAGIWWSTRAIPGVCAFDCFVSWATILANNPNAKVSGGLGFNIGSGWVGAFSGNADALAVTVGADTTTYDFELVELIGPPVDKDECKDNGWQSFNNPAFKNQGDCIQYVNTGK